MAGSAQSNSRPDGTPALARRLSSDRAHFAVENRPARSGCRECGWFRRRALHEMPLTHRSCRLVLSTLTTPLLGNAPAPVAWVDGLAAIAPRRPSTGTAALRTAGERSHSSDSAPRHAGASCPAVAAAPSGAASSVARRASADVRAGCTCSKIQLPAAQAVRLVLCAQHCSGQTSSGLALAKPRTK